MTVIDLDPLLSREIQSPARYLGNEWGAIRRPWDSAQIRWVLSYPELYDVALSNRGHMILYNVLNAQPEQLCDRVYLPGSDFIAALKTHGIPLFALEARRPLRQFDLLGFSLAYELGGTNILEMLSLAGIPIHRWERQSLSLEDCPLVFAGGPTATSNPEPFTDFLDFVVLGDGEEVLPEIGRAVLAHRQSEDDQGREQVLRRLAQIEGVYVPQFYHLNERGQVVPTQPGIPPRIRRRVALPDPQQAISLVPYIHTIHDRLVMEVRRGCTRGCRFCQPGMLTRPARDVDPAAVVAGVLDGLQKTGYDEFTLSSLSCSDYLSLPAVGMELHQNLQHTTLSLPSQRVDRFDEHIAGIMGGSRKGGLTFAPEAGTQRLRDIINKGLTDAELLRGIRTAVEQGWEKIKLYFMIGLPGETDEDVIGIAQTLRWLQRECGIPQRYRTQFTLTISNFTPKPHTPFQWHRVDYADLQRKQHLLKAQLRQVRGIKSHFTDLRFSILEDVIGKGDRRLGSRLEQAWRLGAGMDAWWENIDQAFAAWEQALDLTAVPHFDLGDPLPWDHIDSGLDKAWLQKDYQKALQAMTVADCSFAQCYGCGVCGPELGHNVVVPPPPLPEMVTPSPLPPPERPRRRLRLTYGKQGDLRWIGHLDLMKLWERACRRAGLPLIYSQRFHPTPRLLPALPLPVGYTSCGEQLDLELWADLPLSPEQIRDRLAAQLPADVPLYAVEEGSLEHPTAAQSLHSARYDLIVQANRDPDWMAWITALTQQPTLWIEKTSKKGLTQTFDARPWLEECRCVEVLPNQQARLHFTGRCQPTATLSPPQVVQQLQQSAGIPDLVLTLVQATRLEIQLQSPPAPGDPIHLDAAAQPSGGLGKPERVDD
ncbi:MAG: TIGR03960 family B12-binding radical SAM protein [Synechococcales cyanobacterium]